MANPTDWAERRRRARAALDELTDELLDELVNLDDDDDARHAQLHRYLDALLWIQGHPMAAETVDEMLKRWRRERITSDR